MVLAVGLPLALHVVTILERGDRRARAPAAIQALTQFRKVIGIHPSPAFTLLTVGISHDSTLLVPAVDFAPCEAN